MAPTWAVPGLFVFADSILSILFYSDSATVYFRKVNQFVLIQKLIKSERFKHF